MTHMDKNIAEYYVLHPLLTHQEIADALGCARQTVSKAFGRQCVKDYIEELTAEQWKNAKTKAMKQMLRIMEQDNNLALKFKASEFILKSLGVGNEQKITVDSNEINIKINEDKS